MIGRFIIECDPEHFSVACEAAKYMQAHTEHKELMTSVGQGQNRVSMWSKRLKRSIRIQQVKP